MSCLLWFLLAFLIFLVWRCIACCTARESVHIQQSVANSTKATRQYSTVAILGGTGAAGMATAQLLLQYTPLSKILLLGRTQTTGDATIRSLLAARLTSSSSSSPSSSSSSTSSSLDQEKEKTRLAFVCVDAANEKQLTDVLHTNHVDCLIVCATTAQHTESVIRACIAAHTDYLDILFLKKRLVALEEARLSIEKAGLCFVTEAGFHPGLPSTLIRYAVEQKEKKEHTFDRVDTANVFVFLKASYPWSLGMEELLAGMSEFEMKAFVDGKWKPFVTKDVQLLAWDTKKKQSNGLFLEELRPMEKACPSLKNFGLYMLGENNISTFIMFPCAFLVGKLCWATKLLIRPLSYLFAYFNRREIQRPFYSGVQLQCRGEKSGQPMDWNMLLSHEDGYVFTAIATVACLLQMMDPLSSTSARQTGVHFMGFMCDPERIVKDSIRMGMRIDTSSSTAAVEEKDSDKIKKT